MTPAEHAQDFLVSLIRLAPLGCEVSITTSPRLLRILTMRWTYRVRGEARWFEIIENVEGRDYKDLLEAVEAQVDAEMRANADVSP